jgi:hypothetical protein
LIYPPIFIIFKAGQPDKIESRERDWGSFERTVSAGLPTTIAVKVTGLKSKRYYEAGQSKAGQGWSNFMI